MTVRKSRRIGRRLADHQPNPLGHARSRWRDLRGQWINVEREPGGRRVIITARSTTLDNIPREEEEEEEVNKVVIV
jgi:hypothetical protein